MCLARSFLVRFDLQEICAHGVTERVSEWTHSTVVRGQRWQEDVVLYAKTFVLFYKVCVGR